MSIKEDVESLIEHGYDEDVIMMSTGLTGGQLSFIKWQIEREKKNNSRPAVNQKSKLQVLREKYSEIYNSTLETEGNKPKALTQEQIKEITIRLDKVQKIVEDLRSDSSEGKLKLIHNIPTLYSYMDKLELPYEIAKRAYELIPLNDSRRFKDANIFKKFKKLEEKYRTKYFSSIAEKIKNSNSVEELEKLMQDSRGLEDTSYLGYSSIRSKIIAKENELKKEAYKKYLTIPEDVVNDIVSSLMNPNVDLDTINRKMDEAAKIYYEGRKKSVDNTAINKNIARIQMPTMEGSKKQVSHQIIDAIGEEGLFIDDMDFLYERLRDIGVDRGVACRAIKVNLMASERFNEAEEFVKRVYSNLKDLKEYNFRKSTLSEIKRREIASFILRGIHSKQGTIEEENRYYEMIKAGIESANIDPANISLGKTKDGRKTITWADFCPRPKRRVVEER